MKKNNNTNFLKDLIDSDFLFAHSRDKGNNAKVRFQLSHLKSVEIVNILDLNKSIKQLIRMLKLSTKISALSIYVWVEDLSTVEILNHLLEKENLSVPVSVKTTPPSQQGNCQSTQLLLVLGTPQGYFKSSIYYNFFQRNIFLVCKVNSEKDKHLFGCYKIFNDLRDMKKIIFLSIIINKSIRKARLKA